MTNPKSQLLFIRYVSYTNRYLQAEKSHLTVKHIYFLPTLKANTKKIKELALPHRHPN